jgi:hypothetical protein
MACLTGSAITGIAVISSYTGISKCSSRPSAPSPPVPTRSGYANAKPHHSDDPDIATGFGNLQKVSKGTFTINRR